MALSSPVVSALVVGLYYLILGVLAFYGLHRLLLVALYLRHRGADPKTPPAPLEWPLVTVQLPLYNEMYVAERLIDAVAAFDYPRDRLDIQVLDDSSDETSEIVRRRVEHHRAAGLRIEHLRRRDRRGFKAGALAAGLAHSKAEIFAVFDADFVPAPDLLRRLVPHLAADPKLGMVQARWGHLNREHSLLTRIQAIFLDGHFLVEHTARHRSGCFFNFNGTAGLWRRAAIERAGGWEHDTVTEDLDLSYRAQLVGWRFLYLPEIAVGAELPVDINAFKSQQRRWAKGSTQTARKLLGRILCSALPARVKLEAFVHLTNNASYLLMVLLSVLMVPAMVLRRDGSTTLLLVADAPLFLAATLSVLAFYAVSQTAPGGGSRRQLRYLPALMGLGIGLALSNALAVLSGLVCRGGTFHRTPKYALETRGAGWKRLRYRSRTGPAILAEGLFAAYFLASVIYAARSGMWLSIPFLYLFLQGYAYLFFLTIGSLLVSPRPARPVAAAGGTRAG